MTAEEGVSIFGGPEVTKQPLQDAIIITIRRLESTKGLSAMLRALNWSSYQSYKDRKPPWIRLHKSLIDNYDYQRMSADARAMLPMLWLLASEDDNPKSGLVTKSIREIAFRLRLSEQTVADSIQEIVAAGFFLIEQPCNESVTKPYLNRSSTVTPETETEAETDSLAGSTTKVSTGTTPDELLSLAD